MGFMIMLTSVVLYIDPGPGSLMLQAAIALITGAAFYITLARQRIRRFFKQRFGKKKSKES
jgi:hypothetical protein